MYPIRVSRPIWTRPFIKPHVCTDLCNTQYEINDNVIRITYQTGCLFPEKVEPIHIHISNHTDIEFIDEIVNVPNNVDLIVEYPLSQPTTIQHHFPNTSIRMSDIIKAFDEIYTRIYREEEEQATRKEFWIEKTCEDCQEEDYSEQRMYDFLRVANTEEPCSICFETVHQESETPELFCIQNCRHIFHKPCIAKWFNTHKTINQDETIPYNNSCPNCRQPIIQCPTCKGTRIIKEHYYGSVPPYSPDHSEDRILTDGPYGIHTIYYEELYFKGFVYDRIHNTISLLPLEEVHLETD